MKNIKEIWIVLLSSWTLILTYNILASQTTEDAIWLLVWVLCILGLFITFRENNKVTHWIELPKAPK